MYEDLIAPSKFCVYGTFGFVCDGFHLDDDDWWGVFDSYADARDYVGSGRGIGPRPTSRIGDTMQYTVAGVLSTAAARRAARKLNTFTTPEAAIAAMQCVADDCDAIITFDIIMCVDDEGYDRWAVDTRAYRVSPDYDEPWPDDWDGVW